MKFKISGLFLALLLTVLLGCEPKHDHDHDHAGHNHGSEKAHVHTAPHGGTLVKVGDHFAMIEVKLDPKTGAISVYFLDGEAEKAMVPEMAPKSLAIVLEDKTKVDLGLTGVASSITGETADKTSHMSGQSDKLKNQTKFAATFSSFSIKGQKVDSLAFPFPAGNDQHDDNDDHGSDHKDDHGGKDADKHDDHDHNEETKKEGK